MHGLKVNVFMFDLFIRNGCLEFSDVNKYV